LLFRIECADPYSQPLRPFHISSQLARLYPRRY